MTAGTELAMTQGPVSCGAVNHTPATTEYKASGAAWITGSEEFATYQSEVPSIGINCGGPSKFGVKVGPFFRGTVAVCGIELEITASCACGVPATVGSTAPARGLRRDVREVRRQRIVRHEGPRTR